MEDRTADADDPARLAGQVLAGRYRLIRPIASGGMGTVYRASQLALDRIVAIKVLRPELADDPTLVLRFRREARAAGLLDHPGCVRVIDYGVTDEGLLYLVMEYLHGQDLAHLLHREGRLAWPRACRMIGQVAEALACAHTRGVVHRDLKPANIMVETPRSGPERVRVVDFGIAKILDPDRLGVTDFRTQVGHTLGTPAYMAPEQLRCEEPTPAMDMYALGAVMFEAISGERPYAADSLVGLALNQLHGKPPDLSQFGIPDDVARLAASLLSPQAEMRPTAAEVVACLERPQAEDQERGSQAGQVTRTLPALPAVRTRARAPAQIALVVAVSLGVLGMLERPTLAAPIPVPVPNPRAAAARPAATPVQTRLADPEAAAPRRPMVAWNAPVSALAPALAASPPARTPPPTRTVQRDWLGRGDAARQGGEHRAAIRHWLQHAAQTPSAGVYRRIARSYLALGAGGRACVYLSRSVALGGKAGLVGLDCDRP